jgi:hypothetical protein
MTAGRFHMIQGRACPGCRECARATPRPLPSPRRALLLPSPPPRALRARPVRPLTRRRALALGAFVALLGINKAVGVDPTRPQGTRPAPPDRLTAQPRMSRTEHPDRLAATLLHHPNLDLTPWAAQDLRTGLVHRPVLELLAWLLDDHALRVSVFKSHHTKYVRGTRRVSRHYTGDAMDIGAVGGHPVSAHNLAAHRLVQTLARLPGDQRPSEVGSPWPRFNPLTGFFHDEGHLDHLHLSPAT